MIDQEIRVLQSEDIDNESGIEREGAQAIKDIISERLRPLLFDPSKEEFKLEFLAKWAAEDHGATSPMKFLKLITELDLRSSRDPAFAGLAPIDRMYSLAQRSKAHAAWQEANSVF